MAFFLMGGLPMVVIVVFGLLAVVNAGRFAWAPGMVRLPYLATLGAAIFFAGFAGTAANFMAVAMNVSGNEELAQRADVWLIVLRGCGEALAPMVLSMGLLMAHALLVALGLRRVAV